MSYTPLIVAADFVGIRTDMGVAVAGIMSLVLTVVAVGFLIRVFSR